MSVQYRPLGVVKEMLEQIGVEVTYAYEDLIFIKDNHFLLQFGPKGETLFFRANIETAAASAQQLFAVIRPVAKAQGISLIQLGHYQLSAGEGENLSLQLFDETPLLH